MRQGLLFKIIGILSGITAATSAHALCLLCTCSASAQTMDFGTYTITSLLATTGNFSVACTATLGVSATVTVAASAGNSGDYTNRTMTKGPSTPLNYNLYTDAAHTTKWGGANTMSQTLSIAVLSVTTFNFTIYGLIPASQDVAPGTYSDTLTVTVTY